MKPKEKHQRKASQYVAKKGNHLVDRITNDNHQDGHQFVDQSQWSVFQFSSQNALGMHVSQLFHFLSELHKRALVKQLCVHAADSPQHT